MPMDLYSIGVHGGVVEYVYLPFLLSNPCILFLFLSCGGVIVCFSLSGNKALCGLHPLPSCSMLWDDGGISSGGRVAIVLSSVVGFTMLLLLMYVCYIRRRRNDYGFGFPQDLMGQSFTHSSNPASFPKYYSN